MPNSKRFEVLAACCLVIVMSVALMGENPFLVAVRAAKADQQERAVDTSKRNFVHPGMLHTAESFASIRKNIEDQVQPNLNTWNILLEDGFSKADWNPRLLETVVRDIEGSVRECRPVSGLWHI